MGEIKDVCPDCLVEEGQLHKDGCDHERCAICGRQVLMHGRCDENKREPYFRTVWGCARCGKILPDMFMVSDEEWKKIIGSTYKKNDVLCKNCFDFIKKQRRKI